MTVITNRYSAENQKPVEWNVFPTVSAPKETKSVQQAVSLEAFRIPDVAALVVPRLPEMFEQVTQKEASDTYSRLMRRLTPDANSTENNPLPNTNLAVVESMAMEQMFFAATLLTNEFLGVTAAGKGEVLKALGTQRERLRFEQLEEKHKQLEAECQLQEDAKKSGVIGEIVSWTLAVVDLVVAAAEFVVNPATGANVLAAATGIAIAVCHTLARLHPEDAEKYGDIAEKLGYAQMAFEIAGAVTSIAGAVKKAALSTGLKKVIKEAVPEVMEQALKKGGAEALQTGAKEITETVVKNVMKEMGKELKGKITQKALQEIVGNTVMQATKKAAKKVEKEVAKRVAKEMASQGGKELSQEALKEIKDQVVKQVAKETTDKIANKVTKEVMSKITSHLRVFDTVRTGAHTITNSAKQVAISQIDKKMAATRKEIDELILKIQFFDQLLNMVAERNKEVVDEIKEIQEDQAQLMESGLQVLSNISASQAKIASSMV